MSHLAKVEGVAAAPQSPIDSQTKSEIIKTETDTDDAEVANLSESMTGLDIDSGLPELVRSSLILSLDRGADEGGEIVKKSDKKSNQMPPKISFWHLAKNDGGMFSTRKKQCALWENVWGCSLLFSRIVHAWFTHVKQSTLQSTHPHISLPSALNIGGGLGVTSLAALASQGVSHMMMTDLVFDALRIFNKSLCELEVEQRDKCVMRTLNWDKQETIPEAAFDVVVASDVLFGRWCVKPVAAAVARALKPGGVALVADPCRLNVDDFVDVLVEIGLSARVVELSTATVASVGELATENDGIVPVQRVKLVVIMKSEDLEGSVNVQSELSKILINSLEATLAVIPSV